MTGRVEEEHMRSMVNNRKKCVTKTKLIFIIFVTKYNINLY